MNDYESRLDKAVLNLNEIERLVGQYLVQQDPTDIRLSNPLQHTNIRLASQLLTLYCRK